jgi:hypothetical protein
LQQKANTAKEHQKTIPDVVSGEMFPLEANITTKAKTVIIDNGIGLIISYQ